MARRGHGEGSIFKAADGRWVGQLNLGYENGRRKRKRFYAKTRREVQEKLTAALRDQQEGLPISAKRQNVKDFVTGWLEDVARVNVRPRTYLRYKELATLHLIPSLGKFQLTKLSPLDLQGREQGGRRRSITNAEAYWIAKVRQVAGDLPPIVGLPHCSRLFRPRQRPSRDG